MLHIHLLKRGGIDGLTDAAAASSLWALVTGFRRKCPMVSLPNGKNGRWRRAPEKGESP
jgi:hypothetical protein